jgi:hypothetical protein
VNIRPEKAVNVFPLTMVSNRIEDGDDVDVFDLFVGFNVPKAGLVQAGGEEGADVGHRGQLCKV